VASFSGLISRAQHACNPPRSQSTHQLHGRVIVVDGISSSVFLTFFPTVCIPGKVIIPSAAYKHESASVRAIHQFIVLVVLIVGSALKVRWNSPPKGLQHRVLSSASQVGCRGRSPAWTVRRLQGSCDFLAATKCGQKSNGFWPHSPGEDHRNLERIISLELQLPLRWGWLVLVLTPQQRDSIYKVFAFQSILNYNYNLNWKNLNLRFRFRSNTVYSVLQLMKYTTTTTDYIQECL
jgi:hypothetical protein